jgi:hypothetical protein
MKRPIIGCVWAVLLIAAALCTYGAARAADDPVPSLTPQPADQAKAKAPEEDKHSDVPSLEPDSDHAKSVKTPSPKRERDPAAAAFALPRNTVLTPKQTDALKKLKDKMEPTLRDAIKKMEESTAGADKTAASHKVRDITKDIRTEIDNILTPPDTPAANTNPQPPGTRNPNPQQYRRPGYQNYRNF